MASLHTPFLTTAQAVAEHTARKNVFAITAKASATAPDACDLGGLPDRIIYGLAKILKA